MSTDTIDVDILKVYVIHMKYSYAYKRYTIPEHLYYVVLFRTNSIFSKLSYHESVVIFNLICQVSFFFIVIFLLKKYVIDYAENLIK